MSVATKSYSLRVLKFKTGVKMKILMTGATGLIGQKLGMALVQEGHSLTVISRSARRAKSDLPFPCEVVEGDLTASSVKLSHSFDVVIHLLGESVAHRWTSEKKKLILDSRVQSMRHLLDSLSEAPQMILSANAVGIYGDRGLELLTEESAPGSGFLAEICVQWQDELLKAREKFRKTKLASLRVGVVLSRDGGALPEMLFPFRVGVGGVIGGGNQILSWIHLDDLVKMFCFVIDQKLEGAFNAVAPHPVSNREFSKSLAHGLGRPLGPPVPAFVMKLIFGEMAQVILASQNVSSSKISKLGFRFQYETIDQAFSELLSYYASSGEVLESEQFVPLKKNEIFDFFSEAKNLEALTPETLSFHIKKMSTVQVQEGTLIDYKLQVHGIPMGWRTLISEWKPDSHFVDLQLKGPYKLWRHTHEFIDFAGGTLLRDRVQFKLPAGYLGWLVAGFFVKSDVKKIFAFRRKVISEKFGSQQPST